MKNGALCAALAVMTVVAAGSAIANEVFSVTGYGTTLQQARADAISQGRALCNSQGYELSSFEQTQSFRSGGGWTVFGYTTCF